MARELKEIGSYSKNKMRKYLKVFLVFFIPFLALYFTSYDYLPTFIDLGRYNVVRGFIEGTIATSGIFLGLGNYLTWKMGLYGENKVANNIKNGLDEKYSLFNDVKLIDKDGKRRGNIDHIVVGPNGIFTIETKHTPSKISYDGKNWWGIRGNPSSQAIGHAVRVRNILLDCPIFNTEARASSPFVKAMLVFSHKECVLKIPQDKKPRNCEIKQLLTKTDPCITDFILKESYKFSNDEVKQLEDFLINRIAPEIDE